LRAVANSSFDPFPDPAAYINSVAEPDSIHYHVLLEF
jgi:hypothetical protein